MAILCWAAKNSLHGTVADVAVVLVLARGLPTAESRAGRRAALLPPIVGRGLPAAAAGDNVDGCFVV